MRFLIFPLFLLLAACDFPFGKMDNKFGDQHYKTAIALIELHKIRTGTYPEALDQIEFRGDWDAIALMSVKYDRTDTGYRLEVVRGHTGKPDLKYPAHFYQGLGLENPLLEEAVNAEAR